MKKIYITKDALVNGIIEFCEPEEIKDGVAVVFGYKTCLHQKRKEWCETKKEALKIVEKMRVNEIKKLVAKVAKLENLIFTIKNEA